MAHQDVDVPPVVRTGLEALSLLSRKWHPVVLAVLAHRGPMGFNDLLEAMPGVSGKVLSDTLASLRDAGVVDRTVVSESPLRVRYELTEAGGDFERVLDELAAWGDRHLETATPTVLVVDGDRRLTEMYANWLTDRYAVRRAHNEAEMDARADGDVDVLLFGEGMPGVESAAVADAVDPDCRTVMLVGDPSPLEILTVDCDAFVRKPIVRETAIETIEAQLSRCGESPDRREHGRLSAKLSTVEALRSSESLETNETYRALRSRLETLEDRLEEA